MYGRHMKEVLEEKYKIHLLDENCGTLIFDMVETMDAFNSRLTEGWVLDPLLEAGCSICQSGLAKRKAGEEKNSFEVFQPIFGCVWVRRTKKKRKSRGVMFLF